MTDKIDVSENDEIFNNGDIYFECTHIDDYANYKQIKNNIKITPQNAIFNNSFKMRLISNHNSPYGFSAVSFRNGKWEYMGFGHSGAASIVTALIKQLQQSNKRIEELEKQIKEQRKHYTGQLLAMVNRYNILHNDIKFQKSEQKLKQIEEIIQQRINEKCKPIQQIQQIIKDGE